MADGLIWLVDEVSPTWLQEVAAAVWCHQTAPQSLQSNCTRQKKHHQVIEFKGFEYKASIISILTMSAEIKMCSLQHRCRSIHQFKKKSRNLDRQKSVATERLTARLRMTWHISSCSIPPTPPPWSLCKTHTHQPTNHCCVAQTNRKWQRRAAAGSSTVSKDEQNKRGPADSESRIKS